MTAPSLSRRRGHRLRRVRLVAVLTAALPFLAVACSPAGSESGAGESPSGAGDASASPAVSATPSTSATGTDAIDLPASCPEVVPTVEVDKAIGLQLPGVPVFTMGKPLPDIQRLGRSTCQFGLRPDGSGAAVEATVFLYGSPEAATERIEVTVGDARDQGQLTEDVTAGETPAVILVGSSDLTIIASRESRTYSATLAYGLIAGTDQKPAVTELMAAMLAAGSAD